MLLFYIFPPLVVKEPSTRSREIRAAVECTWWRAERLGGRRAHLASAGGVFDVVFRAAAGLDLAQVQLLVQDLDL